MRFIIFTLCLLSILMSSPARSYEAPCYFGIDSHYTKTPFRKTHGGNFAPKAAPGVNPFVGVNLNPYMALELGYSHSRAVRTTTLNAGEWVAGFPLPAGISPITFKTSMLVRGPHINVIFTSPLFGNFPFQAFGGIGVGQTRATIIRKTMQYSAFVGTAERVMESSRNIRRLTLGLNYFIEPEFAVRFSTAFLKHDRFHQFTCDDTHPFIKQEMRAKNGISYSIGLRWNF